MEQPFKIDLEYLKQAGMVQYQYTEKNQRELAKLAELITKEPITADLIFIYDNTNKVYINGTLTCIVQLPCSRCLEPYWHSLTVKVETETDISALENNTFDLLNELREALILNLPMKLLCRKKCSGLCPTCGVNRNTTDCGCATEPRDERWVKLKEIKINDNHH